MLEIRKVRWKNFLSYGDYESALDFQYPGSCLITGEIEDDLATTDNKKSNGSGKSTIPNAILWGLFGRTMHSTSSGDTIINHFTQKTCEVTIDFKNGDQIIRRRNPGGSTELIFLKDGNETSLVSDTVSTTKEMQSKLAREFNIDFDIFCNSVFFNQYGRPWMEMSEVARRKALERILRVDRFSYYSKIAKAKADNAVLMYNNSTQKETELISQINRTTQEIQIYSEESKNYEIKRASKVAEIVDMINKIQSKIDDIVLPDIDKLTEKWKIIEKIKSEIDGLKSKDLIHYRTITTLEAKMGVLKKQRAESEAQNGKSCVTCGQQIPSTLVKRNVEKINKEIVDIEVQLKDQETVKKENLDNIAKYEKLLQAKLPNLTLIEAKTMSATILSHRQEIARLEKMKSDLFAESDPNQKFIDRLKDSLSTYEKTLDETKKRAAEYQILDKHYNYLYKSYNDRNKVKSFMCEEHLPYINSRLDHYLNTLNLDIRIKIENDLRITSNLWGYNYQSGGERKRTDLAFMLACFDFYEMMYGRQCNLMVLDEVDGRMDEDGIEGLINIIRNDLVNRVDNILVISHRNQMFDVFDKEIKVKRCNRLSVLVGN